MKRRRTVDRQRHMQSTRPRNQKTLVSRRPKVSFAAVLFLLGLALVLGGYLMWYHPITRRAGTEARTVPVLPVDTSAAGELLSQTEVTSLNAQQAEALIKQTNPGFTGPAVALKQQTFRYTMVDENGKTAPVYARVFMPADVVSGRRLPIFAFAPGTTGIDDQCAASLENPAKRNWANYASYMASYATQGYVTVITDYEGMRDADRIHHYMIGNLEGRAVLDSVRTLSQLPLTKGKANDQQVFLSGYSQGGHAALWADKLAASYAPEMNIEGVIGFGPVTDVRQTLTDVTQNANILWFGSYILYSYADWYKETYNLDSMLMPPFAQNLKADISKNCIDTNIGHWGNKDITKVYTKEFIDAMRQGTVAQYSPSLNEHLVQNLAANVKTPSRKLINQGRLDNVVLPSQSTAAVARLCNLGTPVAYRSYPDATHYTTMVRSYVDTLAWMKATLANQSTANDCPAKT